MTRAGNNIIFQGGSDDELPERPQGRVASAVRRNDDTGPVMINFESINYMDSTGLGELIGYLQKFEDRQRKMALVKPSHRILALLKITKLDTVFKIFDSRESAMTYLTDNAA